MDISNFSKDELQKIENVLSTSKTISSIYDNLYILEINNQKDSENYKNLLKQLEDTIKIENQLLQDTCKTYEECKKIFQLLFSAKGLLKLTNNECIIQQSYDDSFLRRTISIISEKIVLDNKFQKDIITPSLVTFLNDLGLNLSIEEIYNEINSNRQIQNNFINDMYLIIISILSEYISDNKYDKYKHNLIKTKYYISFINPNTETHMLKCRFNPLDERYITSSINAELLGISKIQYNIIKENEAKYNISIIMAELLNIKNKEYQDKKTNIEAIIRQCFIRALLTMMNEDTIYEINQNFYNLINNPEYLIKHPNDTISENIIIDCFTKHKHDKTKKREISLKPQ